MSFNPITNQPLLDYKNQNQMKKNQEINDLNIQNFQKEQVNNNKFKQNKSGEIPVEYNPYKRPYAIYPGHP